MSYCNCHLVNIWLSSGRDIPSFLKSALEKLSLEHPSGISLNQLESPMMQQYKIAKDETPDALLFFRMGDFYELFGLDAIIASDICQLTLTSRDKNNANPVPMAGTPVVSYKNALKKCLQSGFKVAVCDQVEDSKQAKGLVKREITRIATPAVPGDLDDEEAHSQQEQFGCYLASVLEKQNGLFTLSFVDVSTGDFRITSELTEAGLVQELSTLLPKEILTSRASQKKTLDICKQISFARTPSVALIEHWILTSEHLCKSIFCDFFDEKDLAQFGILQIENGLACIAAILNYLKVNQKFILENIKKIVFFDTKNYLLIDEATKKHLDFFLTSSGERRGSFFHFLNRCLTPSGTRQLLNRLNYPFKEKAKIEQSLDAIEEMAMHPLLIQECIALLKTTADIDRILARAAQRALDPRTMARLSQTLIVLEKLLDLAAQYKTATLFCHLVGKDSLLNSLSTLSQQLQNALVEEPAVQIGKGLSIFRKGYHKELDEVIDLESNFQEKLENLEKFERDRSQISTLRIGYNRISGYYFEISKGRLSSVPKHFMRKQTLTNGERFVTPELKELEDRLATSLERRTALEKDLLESLRLSILFFSKELSAASEILGSLDLVLSFTDLQREYNWSRPKVTETAKTILKQNTHPILSALANPSEPFIKNDVEIGIIDANASNNPLLHLITGPNMAGKSTIMRQVALSQILCQMGSFVPAQIAEIGIADRILSRIGSADHALKNRSTFMVEMLETANILKLATPKSLLLLDEVGRGTSTFDGLSLAWALLEHLHDHVQARTLFSTHYHELGAICQKKQNIQPMQMSIVEVLENADVEILFSRQYQKGLAGKSYGLHVARLAGIPEHIIFRAEGILRELENSKKEPSHFSEKTSYSSKNKMLKKSRQIAEGEFTLF